jgi:hypothetical protein
MAGGCVHIPWYATGFRADTLEESLEEIAPLALRFGATSYAVYRYRDDRYKFLQTATFETKSDWERYWGGEDFTRWRTVHNGHYQVPVLYQWTDISIEGALPSDPIMSGARASVIAEPGEDVTEGDTI